MATRITGMVSGLDTESLIQELVKAKSAGVEKLKKNKTKADWKQDAWKDLNKKVKSLFAGTVSNLRWSSTFSKKKTSVSNPNAVSVITGSKAMNSVQNLSIKKLAKSGYLTGQEVSTADGTKASGSTLISELALRDADGNPIEGLAAIADGGSFSVTTGGKTTKINVNADTTIDSLVSQLNAAGVRANFDEKNQRLFVGASGSGKNADFAITADNSIGFAAMSLMGINAADDETSKAQYEKFAALDGMSLDEIMADTESDAYKLLKNELNGDDDTDYDAAYAKLQAKISYAANIGTQDASLYSKDAVRLTGEDAEISLNGVKFTSDTNNFEVNGLTFVCNSIAEDITVTTQDDTDGVYDVVKNFLKEYNSLINEMDKLYNADYNKAYEPLSDDEKEILTDSEIEKIEGKVKDSLLRKDETLGDLFNSLREVMAQGINVGGKTMYLSDFGINQLNYFSAEENQRNAYHIDGDSDDEATSGNTDKLKSMIAADPDTVVAFFTNLGNNLYSKMTELSSTTEDRSFGNFYNDKSMKVDISDIEKKIADAEQKLNAYEDKYYAKFAAMETALAKMQESSSYVSSLFGSL